MSTHSLSTVLTVSDLHLFNDEPRISELRLGELLQYDRTRAIRNIIRANWDELCTYGEICFVLKNEENPNKNRFCRAARQNTPDAAEGDSPMEKRGRGRPGVEYYFNEDQALILCLLSRTAIARQIRRQIISVYKEWRTLKIAPAAIITNETAARLLAHHAHHLELALAPHWPSRARPKFWDRLPIRHMLIEQHRLTPLCECAARCREAFGDQAPSRDAIRRFWNILDKARGVSAKRGAA